ncbi:MAG: 4-(cytidine 5'-diphospho)-2-C-methyl-D-erythritol kinase [Planctomycetes bacterium]|nr:4-(cytidine 5'-diphospho)-2-C-methyl-D-erythritol kinase [Planctomycetota bacterium]HJM56703.1 4-(cytidine 5'-diphospho)-2-C-methyl-D-erythritol kinase [Planctomycetota bacterium]
MSAARNSHTALAPAKVNLTLEVLGRRPDGFHELRTVLLALDLCDRVHVRCDSRQESPLQLCVTGPAASEDIPTDERNLVHRAAQLALTRLADMGTAPLPPLCIELEKHVPSQAGLGGGSSDAAATLRSVQAIAGRDLGREWRQETLAELGSDCVFFDAGAVVALCEGRGERVRALPAPHQWNVALVVPEVTCSTAEVFGHVPSAPVPSSAARSHTDLLAQDPAAARDSLFNDLESAAREVEPLLGAWTDLLSEAGLDHYRLTGSGSSLFGLYADPEEAQWDLAAVSHLATERGLGVRLACCVPCWSGKDEAPSS